MKKTITFLASGNGGTLKFIFQAIERLGLPLTIIDVVTDRDCGALEYAQSQGLRATHIAYSRKTPAELQRVLAENHSDLVVTNIHKIIDAETLDLLPGSFVNLHYSLLPAFKGFIGMETVVQAQLLNTSIIGATCHEVDELVDNGRVLSQCAMPVDWNHTTPVDMHEAVFRGASLCLLDGLMQKTGLLFSGRTEQLRVQGRLLLFSPALCFDATALDESFWLGLKN